MGIILLIGLIGLLIFLFFTVRNMQKDPSLKSKYKNSSRFLFASGIFCFFNALVFWYGWSQGSIHFKGFSMTPAAIFYLVFSYLGIKGVVVLFILFGILFIVKARSLKRKSERIEENEAKVL